MMFSAASDGERGAMVGDDGPDSAGEAAAYARLQNDLYRIVERAARRPGFASELDELHLSHYTLAMEVAEDPAVLSRARLAYQPILDQQGKLKAHWRSYPAFWPQKWRPQPMQLAAIAGAVLLPALWWIFLGSRSAELPPVLAWLGFFLVLPVLLGARALAKWGLPNTTWRWQQWVREHVLLYLRIPVQRLDWQQSIREDVVLPEIREWINEHKKPSFDHVLRLRDATGLRLPPDLGPLVHTASIHRCIREINRMVPGAAVGLAGRRGAGKTTVIERAADNEFSDAKRQPYLAVVASAPVRYDARDFVLHLHAAACRAVINHLAGSAYSAPTETERQWNRLHLAERGKSLVASMLRGLFKAELFSLAALLCAVWAWGSNGAVVRRELFTLTEQLLTDPGKFLSSGQWQDVLGLATVVLLLIGAGLVLAKRLVAPIVTAIAAAVWRLLRWALRSRPAAPHAALRRLAEQQLHRIRFLQTHTDGWSGKLSSPAWTGFGLTRTVQRAEQPLTHPEVIERLRDFLSTVARVLVPFEISGVIVAIDELDKISDPVEAQTFLNEIKGVFGIPWCLFLVSVSEDALTAFERRGIPVRDTFDSAFTTMIYIAPFTLTESRTWLAQRAIGIPEPFVCLCHCLSGGLPRELGRTATILHDLYIEADDPDDRRLASVAQAMVAADLTTKIRAFAHTAAQLQPDNDGGGDPSELLGLLDQAVTGYGSEDLHTLTRNVWPTPEITPTTALQRLQAEVASYIYFCATLLEVFTDDLSEPNLAQACDDTHAESLIDTLCRARQQLGVNAQASWQLLVTFRRRWGLYTIEEAHHAVIN